jgi:branched-chain amino acid transport system ATP-binding protein
MLEVKHISVLYDRSIVALQDVDFKIEKGSIVALLGPNGAGKSTLMKAVTGMLPFEHGDVADGSIWFEGSSLDAAHPAVIARRGIAFVQDGRQCFRNLTIQENLKAASRLQPKRSNERLEMVFSYFPVLKEMHERQAGFLSGGQLQMLVIAMALMGNPKLLLLDEPSLGLSPVMVQAVFDVVERMHKDLGMTVVVAEQTVPRLLKMAVDLYVLSRGQVVMHAAPQDVDEAALQRVYLS